MSKESDFEAFFTDNYLRMYHYAQRFVDDDETCRDIVEDPFEQYWTKMETITAGKQVGYLFMVVRNKCVDHTRHFAAQGNYVDFFRRQQSEAHADDEREVLLETEQYIETVNRMMDELPEKTRHILKECYLKERTHVSVAKELGISATAVRKHILHALDFFRKKLPKNGE